MTRRLLVIGLDGFETTIADALIREGRMPNLEKLMGNAARVNLEHGPAKRTGLAWEHFSTGLTPESAQRWSAVTFDAQRYRCWQTPTRLPPFPSKLDVKTVIFDAPYFDLGQAQDVEGMVSWGAHDPGTPQRAHPDSLAAEIQTRFGIYPAEPWIYGYTWASPSRTRLMSDALVEATHSRAEISQWLLRDRFPEWSLGIVVVSELHSAVEALWHGIDEAHPLHALPSARPARRGLEAVYAAVDGLIGRLVESFPESSHLVFSMHGMGPNEADVAAMALLPEFLYRRHFGRPRLRTNADERGALVGIGEDESWTAHVRSQWIQEPPKPRKRDSRLLRSFVQPVRQLIQRIRRAGSGANADSLAWMPAAWYAPYWPTMSAFALPAFYDGQIRLNVHGREARGVVVPDHYDSVCQAIASELTACTDPRTSRSVVREVVFTHPGDPSGVTETEADMIIVWQDAPTAFQSSGSETIGPLAYRRPGGHTGGYGLSLWSGSDFSAGERSVHSAFDVVPTIVEYLTVNSQCTCDGRSFLAEIQSEHAASRPNISSLEPR